MHEVLPRWVVLRDHGECIKNLVMLLDWEIYQQAKQYVHEPDAVLKCEFSRALQQLQRSDRGYPDLVARGVGATLQEEGHTIQCGIGRWEVLMGQQRKRGLDGGETEDFLQQPGLPDDYLRESQPERWVLRSCPRCLNQHLVVDGTRHAMLLQGIGQGLYGDLRHSDPALKVRSKQTEHPGGRSTHSVPGVAQERSHRVHPLSIQLLVPSQGVVGCVPEHVQGYDGGLCGDVG
mmetsp:Transcript_36275/g.79200  ORF Transcript_36275/g.79200 Transcript_36275/m.79200 type:complete len:233 (+) Transcript_36275:588-1286(+)